MRAVGCAFVRVILILSRHKPLWDEIEVNLAKHNVEKEVLRANESIEKKNFIINGIAKYI